MGFGDDLQGSQDALYRLQSYEIQLLEIIRRCVSMRAKCDKEYSQALIAIAETAIKIDHNFTHSSIKKAWQTIASETQTLANLLAENANALSEKTLEKINSLICTKKLTKRTFETDKNRIDTSLNKAKAEVVRLQSSYIKQQEKVKQDQVKLEEYMAKGKHNAKLDETKSKLVRDTAKLHRLHNEYLMNFHDIKTHQKQHISTVLPGLLDLQQKYLEENVQQCSTLLTEFAERTNLSDEDYCRCHREISRSIRDVNCARAYDLFMETNRTLPLQEEQFEIGEALSEDLILDEFTVEQLKEKQRLITEELKATNSKLDEHQKELGQHEAAGQNLPIARTQHAISELQCSKERLQDQEAILSELFGSLGSATLPSGISFSDNDGESIKSHKSEPSGRVAMVGAKLQNLKSHITGFRPFKRSSHEASPPKPPDRDFDGNGELQAASLSSQDVEEETASLPQACSSCVNSNPSEDVENEDWFHGILPREEAQSLLKEDGDFLIRQSKNKRTGELQYVLSVLWQDHKHFIIQGTAGSWRFEAEAHTTVKELVEKQILNQTPVTNKSQAILRRPVVREEWELKLTDLELGDSIGKGNFGEVYIGKYRPKKLKVAIKTCRETVSEEMKKKFLKEGRILKQYDHPNIVRFVGIQAHRQPVMIVMEYVAGGSLLAFLRSHLGLATRNLLQMCRDAACGMDYLEQKSCIHRDLAARNCLVSEDGVVKISDFGMSREEEEYTVSDGLKQIPIKWTALEALNYGKYTSLCDVWSYGILMWEVFSFGQTPYQGMSNSQAREQLETGYRMPAPDGTPSDAYEIMASCWNSAPDQRPHFCEIVAKLDQLLRVF